MAIGIAVAAEEHGKIVSARHFCNAVKSYLPTHGTFHKIAPCALCIFADAIRKECAEAKSPVECCGHTVVWTQSARSAPRQRHERGCRRQPHEDAIRKECAEAKRGNERFVFLVFRTLRNFSGETRMLRQVFPARINPPEAALVFPKSASGGFLLLFCHFP